MQKTPAEIQQALTTHAATAVSCLSGMNEHARRIVLGQLGERLNDCIAHGGPMELNTNEASVLSWAVGYVVQDIQVKQLHTQLNHGTDQ